MKQRTKSFDKSLILLGLILLTMAATGVFIYLQVRIDKVTETIKRKEPLSVLFVVNDGTKPVFTEVFMYHPSTYEGAVLDIPGNLGLIIKSLNRMDRIDVLYKKGNSRSYRERIEEVTGISIPFQVELSLDDIEHLVDLLDGVELFIANPVEDLESEVPVLLPSGSLTLDGSKVRDYIMHEDPGEVKAESINRRQRFLQSLLKTMGQEAAYLENESVFPYLKQNITTNMDARALLSFVGEMNKLDADSLVFQNVLGTERQVDEQRLLFPHFEGELLKGRIRQILDTLASLDKQGGDAVPISLQILNGTGESGLAGRVSRLYQTFGFADTVIGNADRSDYESTVVIDRRGNITNAQKVADVIRCSSVESVADEALDEKIDVTIILGKDFDGRYCK